MHANPFSASEIDRRIALVRAGLERRKLDAAIFASPENVFYLTGLDHWGYFAPHLLIVPADGEPTFGVGHVGVDPHECGLYVRWRGGRC